MAIDYQAISDSNLKAYGTEIESVGPVLLSNLYAERTHFIFELLQNAEDALRRRQGWTGDRGVRFEIDRTALTVRHYGEPFNEADVRAICGIAEGTKGDKLTDIGRFGIGFKSVYAYTDAPRIYSGGESFAIRNYVHPEQTAPVEHGREETVIVIPFQEDVLNTARDEIIRALERDAFSALRFLSEIEEISWRVEGIESGRCLRKSIPEGDGVRRVIMTPRQSHKERDEEWLVFSEPVAQDNRHVGCVAIAFFCADGKDDQPAPINKLRDSSFLNAYFPTIVETHLGFLMHGPYRTTPSRDNVPAEDEWNQKLVDQTAALLVNALRWLRDRSQLSAAVLESLPLDPVMFGAGKRFKPLFDAAREAILTEPLLPAHPDGYVSAQEGVFGTEELRALFSAEQLTALLARSGKPQWISGAISERRTPALYRYLSNTLGAQDVGTNIVMRLETAFLQEQSEEWMRRLYEFLNRRTINREQLEQLPLIRLQDGSQATIASKPYLPGDLQSDSPTVHHAVCDSSESLKFLTSAGLRKYTPVDDLVKKLRRTYGDRPAAVDHTSYAQDAGQIVRVWDACSVNERKRLISELRKIRFVRAYDADTGEFSFAKPADVYAATPELQELYAGISGILFAVPLAGDDPDMREFRELLEECGVSSHVRLVEISYSKIIRDWPDRLRELERDLGRWLPHSTKYAHVKDQDIDHLDEVLKNLESAAVERQRALAQQLWDSLRTLVRESGLRSIGGRYDYFYYTNKYEKFPPKFVRALNAVAWIPAENGQIAKAGDVQFSSLGWQSDPLLEKLIKFQEPMPENQVNEEERTERDIAALVERLGVGAEMINKVFELVKKVFELVKEEGCTMEELEKFEAWLKSQREVAEATTRSELAVASNSMPSERETRRSSIAAERAAPRKFHSFVAVGRAEPVSGDGDAATAARLALEQRAIDFICKAEPRWKRTKSGNPGFDLYQVDADGDESAWCEVKSMSGAWRESLAGMSRRQFDFAREQGERYWLYVVERADDPERTRILRIQDPAGQARTFTFDHGWSEVADAAGPPS